MSAKIILTFREFWSKSGRNITIDDEDYSKDMFEDKYSMNYSILTPSHLKGFFLTQHINFETTNENLN